MEEKNKIEKNLEEKVIDQENKNRENDKKTKNLISAVIILAGLFIGSLFIDVVQLLKGSGFSERNLSKSEIFETLGKTWVAYNEPLVEVKVISDDSCEKCDPGETLVWLRRVAPTINARKINADSEEGKALIGKMEIKTLPAFVFAESVTKSDFYFQAQSLFVQKENEYLLRTQELGLTPGKYLALPEIKDGDAIFGKADSSVKVAVFSDFQCPYCKLYWKTLRETMKQYQDKAVFVYKHLPLSFHAQAENAALASACALEQNKFWEYSDRLFASQSDWSNSEGTQKFKNYARTSGLNSSQFNQCLDGKKFQSKIDADKKEAGDFGISGTPATFVNSQFRNGVISSEELKALLDQELK